MPGHRVRAGASEPCSLCLSCLEEAIASGAGRFARSARRFLDYNINVINDLTTKTHWPRACNHPGRENRGSTDRDGHLRDAAGQHPLATPPVGFALAAQTQHFSFYTRSKQEIDAGKSERYLAQVEALLGQPLAGNAE